MTRSESFHLYFRNCLYNYIKENKKDLIGDNQYIDLKNTYIKLEDYIDKIKTEYFYAGELEMIAATKLFNINIYI